MIDQKEKKKLPLVTLEKRQCHDTVMLSNDKTIFL